MKRYASGFRAFAKDEDGATMVEYGLMVALIAVVAGVAAATLGTNISTMFSNIATTIAGA
jgi:pilus assembly protein Flp/PilA